MGLSRRRLTGTVLIAILAGAVFALFVSIGSAYAQAEIQDSLCAGANFDVNSSCSTGITDEDAAAKINSFIGTIINMFSLVVGVVSVIMIIIGGFRYITSGGDSSNVSGAKNTIMYAIIGLVIVALAQTIVRFILGRVVAL